MGDAVRQDAWPEPPATPRKSHFHANKTVNDRVRYLRDELGLAIAPREEAFSPSQFKESSGNRLYERIKYLSFKKSTELDEVIEAYRLEITQHSKPTSAQQRTNLLLDKLHDLAWLTKNSMEAPLSKTQSPSTLPATPSSLRRASLRRFDSVIDREAGRGPASPSHRKSISSPSNRANLDDSGGVASPTTRKSLNPHSTGHTPIADEVPSFPSLYKSANLSRSSFASTNVSQSTTYPPRSTGAGSTRNTTANTSFATSTEDVTKVQHLYQPVYETSQSLFGSSWASQDMTPLRRKSESEDKQPLFAALEQSELPPAKRRRSGDSIIGQRDQVDSPRIPEQGHKKKHEHHQIRSLPRSGFGTDFPYTHDENVPYTVRVERARMVHETVLTPEQVVTATDHASARELLASHGIKSFQHSSPDIWNPDAGRNDARLDWKGEVKLNMKSDGNSLLQLSLHPIKKEAMSTRLGRRFGSSRVLVIETPSLTQDLPNHFSGSQKDALLSAFQEWLLEPKAFLGRVWRIFFIDDSSDKKKTVAKKPANAGATRLCYFFATSGNDISEPMSHFQLLDWMLPFDKNANQAVCKAFARISLSIKRTMPTVVFEPDQIRFVDDIVANGEPEDETWEDPAFTGKLLQPFSEQEIMTDGCATISVGAAINICKENGITDRPTVFQGRINGSKGLWQVSGSYDTLDPEHLAPWIEIRPSQLKIKPRSEDLTNSTCEADRWSFDVVSYSGAPKCSLLYKDFLRILEDRGVSRKTLLEMIREEIAIHAQEWREAATDPARLVLQRSKHFDFSGDKPRRDEPGLPRIPAARIQLLLDEAGFMPAECQPLAEAVERMQEHHFQRIRSELKFTCLKSTNVFGVADPYGVLAPGEVHLSLSRTLVHESTNETFDMFAGRSVLMARSPALRGSDMQRVKCVCHPALAHLKDVVVMSTKGKIPLAAKLQGGDYDGDKFWVCADERLVDPFKNAPVIEQRGIEQFPIKQETRKLQEIVDDEHFGTDRHVRKWLEIVLPFACREKMLGQVTNRLYRLTYHHNDLWHEGVRLLADLHDLIIDDSKNGYHFDANDFVKVTADHSDICPPARKLKLVRYQENLDEANIDSINSKGNGNGQQEINKPILRETLRKYPQRRYSSVLDDAVFNVINPHFAANLEDFHRSIVEPAQSVCSDPDLQFTLSMIPTDLAKAENSNLKSQLTAVYNKWIALWQINANNNNKASTSTSLETPRNDIHTSRLHDCMTAYSSIQPLDAHNPLWAFRPGPTAPTVWECFKAAWLARNWYAKRKKFVFWVARDAVCYLKAASEAGKRTKKRVKLVMKPRRPRDWAELEWQGDGGFADVGSKGDGEDGDWEEDGEHDFLGDD